MLSQACVRAWPICHINQYRMQHQYMQLSFRCMCILGAALSVFLLLLMMCL